MLEPVYEEDPVNLGYLKKTISETEESINNEYANVSRHYASKPTTPYYKGDTWIDGNIVYTCINSREIGLYTDSDWVTESGAKKEAESKNKVYLTQPSNYNVGDMWILQSDEDHKSGKKGEILISIAGRKDYNEADWVNMLDYGNISSINEVSNNLNDAINRIENVEEALEDGLITTFYQNTVPEGNIGDLWYVTENTGEYLKGKIYRYDGTSWLILNDPSIQEAFEEANEARIVADGKIQSFYSEEEPTQGMGVGDLWIDTANNNHLYRYNGTNWVAVYDTRIEEVVKDLETITERTVTIVTDLGEISQTVAETTTTTDQLTGTIESINEEISNIKQNQESWVAKFNKTGGNNLSYYSLEFWESYSGIEEYSDSEMQINSVSGKGYLIGSGTSKQNIKVQNGTYTISFRYKKIGPELANAVVRINGEEYSLTETNWTDFVKTIDVTTNHIEVELSSDTNDTLYVTDLLITIGANQEVWTQNPNEVRTDTVTIGKGIKVESSETNTYTKIDSDGNRTFNKTTNERVAEMTDKGVYAKEIECEGQAQIAGLLIQQIRKSNMAFKLIIIA